MHQIPKSVVSPSRLSKQENPLVFPPKFEFQISLESNFA
jgi:hypothetical protein